MLPAMKILHVINDEAEPVSLSCCSRRRLLLGGRSMVDANAQNMAEAANAIG